MGQFGDYKNSGVGRSCPQELPGDRGKRKLWAIRRNETICRKDGVEVQTVGETWEKQKEGEGGRAGRRGGRAALEERGPSSCCGV